MALPQDIRPVNSELADSITRSSEIPWIETKPGEAWTKVLWVGQESGRWAVLLKWKKGYVAPPHKHLSAAFAFVLSGRLQVRDNVYGPGDFLHEVNGMVHGATTALEDTEYLFFCDGPVLFFDKDGFTGYRGWEQVLRMQQAGAAEGCGVKPHRLRLPSFACSTVRRSAASWAFSVRGTSRSSSCRRWRMIFISSLHTPAGTGTRSEAQSATALF